MNDAPDDSDPRPSDTGPAARSGEILRVDAATERPFQRQRRIEQEGNVARWDFFGRLRASTRSETVTTALLAANFAVFAAMVTLGVAVFEPSPDDLLAWGALRPILTRDTESWRLLTAMFLHIGLLHLAVNMFSLWSMRFVEHWFGHVSFAVLYIVSGLCGSLASTTFSDPFIVGAGASGALFGVLGAVLGAALRWKRLGIDSRVTGPILKGVFNTIVINAVIAASIRNLDHFAHAGGFASGIVLGYLLARAPTAVGVAGRSRRGWRVAAISCAVIVALVFALRIPGLAAAGERVETVRTDENEISAWSLDPEIVNGESIGPRADWLPYLASRVTELRAIETNFPSLQKGVQVRLRWYEEVRSRLTARLAQGSPPRTR